MSSKTYSISLILLMIGLAYGQVFSNNAGALDYGMNTSLSDIDVVFEGESADDRAGWGVSGTGDVNGDGYDDILISAKYNDEHGERSGKVYLYFGGRTQWAGVHNLSDADVEFYAGYWANLGHSLSRVGDVNGDGYDDIFIGSARKTSRNWPTCLIFGKPSGWKKRQNITDGDVCFYGAENDGAGHQLAGAGDVNADGFDDLLIGYWYNSDKAHNAGKVWLILGRDDWKDEYRFDEATVASYHGEKGGIQAGYSLGGGGDVDGDGYDDFVIGSLGHHAYLIFGRGDGWEKNKNLSESDASFWGEYDEAVGKSVAIVGDVNGDHYDDIIIGASSNDEVADLAGQAYLVFGKADGWYMDQDINEVANASFTGLYERDYLGEPVNGAGDVNGDGLADILIATYQEDAKNDRGRTYLVLGKTQGWSMDTSINTADASFIGEEAYDDSGLSVASAGDVDGDGLDEMLIGAPQHFTEDNKTGRAYLIFTDTNPRPSSIISVKAYSDPGYKKEIRHAEVEDEVFIELSGTDAAPDRKNTALVNITSNETSPLGFTLRLYETGPDTGVFRNHLTIKNITHEGRRWIGASHGETVIARSIRDPSKEAKVFLGPLSLAPDEIDRIAVEDEEYSQHIWAERGLDPIWTFDTNASWLSWDETTHDLTGTPDNADVGEYWVLINVSDGMGQYDEHNFTLEVLNRPPEILTRDHRWITAGENHSNDYDSDDDGQGDITWHLDTNATWLSMDPETGELSGHPTSNHTGEWPVNVSVDDGNGGWGHSDYVLTVLEQDEELPPIVNILAPSAGAEVAIEFDVEGWVETPGGVLDVLEYRLDGGAWAPLPAGYDWGFSVGPLSPGEHEISVRATSASDLRTVSSVNVTVRDDPPMIKIESPENGQEMALGATLDITGTASDPEGHIVDARVIVNGSEEHEITLSDGNYSLALDLSGHGPGPVQIEARVTDRIDQVATDSVLVVVIGPPTVEILSPEEGAEVGEEVALSLSVNYTGRSSPRLLVYMDGTLVLNDVVTPGAVNLTLDRPVGPGTEFEMGVLVRDGLDQKGDDAVNVVAEEEPPGTSTTREGWICLSAMIAVIVVCFMVALYDRFGSG